MLFSAVRRIIYCPYSWEYTPSTVHKCKRTFVLSDSLSRDHVNLLTHSLFIGRVLQVMSRVLFVTF